MLGIIHNQLFPIIRGKLLNLFSISKINVFLTVIVCFNMFIIEINCNFLFELINENLLLF